MASWFKKSMGGPYHLKVCSKPILRTLNKLKQPTILNVLIQNLICIKPLNHQHYFKTPKRDQWFFCYNQQLVPQCCNHYFFIVVVFNKLTLKFCNGNVCSIYGTFHNEKSTPFLEYFHYNYHYNPLKSIY